MKIVAQKGSDTPFELCPGGQTGPIDFNLQTTSEGETKKGLRWQRGLPVDRDNVVESLSFTTARDWATEADSESYILKHRQLMPRQAKVTIDCEGAEKLVYADCRIICTSARFTGLNTFHTYQVETGDEATKV